MFGPLFIVGILGILLNAAKSTQHYKSDNPCHTVKFSGCNISNGRCVCDKVVNTCYNPFNYTDLETCLQRIFASDYMGDIPMCKPARVYPLCAVKHVGTKYCYGSCDTKCCLIGARGCLPPTNIYVPVVACVKANQRVCDNYRCAKGYKCESVKERCPVFPCMKEPKCIVDDEYDPCPLVRCSQERGRKICERKRTKCGEDACPYTFSCTSWANIRPSSTRSVNSCHSCPTLSLQESYCKNDFAVRLKVNHLLWHKRWYNTIGLCYWYNTTVEYILKHNPSAPALYKTSAILLIKARTSQYCTCPGRIKTDQRYFAIGNILESSYDKHTQMIHIPSNGYAKQWSLVKRRRQYLYFDDCPTLHTRTADN